MTLVTKRYIVAALSFLLLLSLLVVAFQESKMKREETHQDAIVTGVNEGCVTCHKKDSPALVMEWEYSQHAKVGIGCTECHKAEKEDIDAWLHEGTYISALVTPKDCARCHTKEYEEFSTSHHARAGEILASLDNVLAEKVAGLPDNKADAVNGCWQCHGTIIKFEKDADGNILRSGNENRPVIDHTTWPNSGVGRMNPDGSKVPVMPATPDMLLKVSFPVHRKIVVNATWVLTIRKSRYTTKASMALLSTPTVIVWH